MTTSRGQLCERARQWASLRADGELSELEHALLDAHLSRCAACRSFAAEADGIAAALRAVTLERIPAPVVLDLPRRRRVSVRAIQGGIAAALVLVAAALGSALGVANRTPESQAAPKHTAMIALAQSESPETLRALRRPGLIASARQIPRNRFFTG